MSEEDEKEEKVQTEEMLETSTDFSSWESLAVDTELWDLLVQQLEDTLSLSTLLHLTILANDCSSTTETSGEPIKVSVSKLLDGGKGL